MANLPNKPFVFNFNAKNYNQSTFTIPNEEGATMDRDMVWSATTSTVRSQIAFSDDHITVPSSAFSHFEFTTSGANPINNTTSAPAMTIIAKFRLTGGGPNLICNRDGSTYNLMARVGAYTASTVSLSLHTANSNSTNSGQFVSYTKGSVITALWRVNSSRQIEIKNLTAGTSNTPFTSTWNNGSKWFDFFIWCRGGNPLEFSEPMAGEFYWCYFSKEVLTDEEVQQVIKFNERSFGPDSTGTTIAQSGGTSTANIEAETGWTVTTKPTWVTVSPSSGESGTTSITFTIKKNNFSSRTGTVVFTDDGGNEAEYTIDQGGTDGLLPYNKIYRNGRRIN